MKEQQEEVIKWLKEQKTFAKGCITGSCFLGYFEGADVDFFAYDEKSFTEIFYAMLYNPMFQILEEGEEFKAKGFRTKNGDFYKYGMITIKFMYNTCMPVNIIIKRGSSNIHAVLSSFDMDIVAKGYDLETKQMLDLSENLPNKEATWNTWNTAFYGNERWKVTRVLRQLSRCFKYHKRGYNTDKIVLKYMELLEERTKQKNIFKSERFQEMMDISKNNIKIVKKICQIWLETHEITDDQEELLQLKIKEI